MKTLVLILCVVCLSGMVLAQETNIVVSPANYVIPTKVALLQVNIQYPVPCATNHPAYRVYLEGPRTDIRYALMDGNKVLSVESVHLTKAQLIAGLTNGNVNPANLNKVFAEIARKAAVAKIVK